MLVLLASDGARLDAGAVGLALARRWSDAGQRVLFADADTSGSRLARRLGEVEHADYSPAVRGLPSLIVARKPLTLRLLAEHCYSLDTASGSLWALFAPFHPGGGSHAARWLAERADDLAAIDRERRVVVSSSLRSAGRLGPLLQAAPVVVVVAPVESAEQAKELWTQCRDADLMGFGRGHRVLVVAGDSALSNDDLGAETTMPVAGRLPVIDDDSVLRLKGGRRDRAFAKRLDSIAGRLLSLVTLAVDEIGEAPDVEIAAPGETAGAPGAETPPSDGSGVPDHVGAPRESAGNGAAVPPESGSQVPGARRERQGVEGGVA